VTPLIEDVKYNNVQQRRVTLSLDPAPTNAQDLVLVASTFRRWLRRVSPSCLRTQSQCTYHRLRCRCTVLTMIPLTKATHKPVSTAVYQQPLVNKSPYNYQLPAQNQALQKTQWHESITKCWKIHRQGCINFRMVYSLRVAKMLWLGILSISVCNVCMFLLLHFISFVSLFIAFIIIRLPMYYGRFLSKIKPDWLIDCTTRTQERNSTIEIAATFVDTSKPQWFYRWMIKWH